MKEPRWVLYVTYPGYSRVTDQLITKAVGREESGAGVGFGQRDLYYDFYQERAAVKAAKRVTKLTKKATTSVERTFT